MNWSAQMVLDSNLNEIYSAATWQLQIEPFVIFWWIEAKARPGYLSVSEVYIYQNNQNMIPIVAIRPNINQNNNNFLSCEYNCVDFNYVREKQMSDWFQLFWK
jgi:hypothetical protein